MARSAQFRLSTLITTHAAMVSVAFLFLTMLATGRAQAQDFSVLYRFTSFAGGFHPYGVIMDQDGNLYGPNLDGGKFINNAVCEPQQGCGTLFKLSASGTETTLFTFGARPSGKFPNGLVRDTAGNLYGTTGTGGANGFGVVFKLDPAGSETILHAFAGVPGDGNGPGGLLRDATGNFYGTTGQGGAFNSGTIFKIDPQGVETVLYSFGGTPDGSSPGGLIRDSAGNFYGVTGLGGTHNSGTVFKVDATGTETVLYNFTGGTDGFGPAGLIQDAAGNFYGTTSGGGAFGTFGGTVFKLDTTGTETVLHSFGEDGDGYITTEALLLDSAGNLYGTTAYGGAYNFGTVYKLDPTGTETIIHFFSGRVTNDGLHPQGKLIRDANGNLYGTTYGAGGGIVYKIALPH
jgi:uncharacterized repeat protein (TIGR03803 family)